MPDMGRMMWIALLGAAIAVVAMPAAALGSKQGDYEGRVKGAPGSEITFKVDRRKGEANVKVFRFNATEVPTDCAGSPDKTEYGLPGYFGLPLRDGGKFHIKDSPSGFRDDSLFVLHGRVERGGRASGTLRIVDDFDLLPTCSTGVVDWSASK
jgi:hypothetical protein